MAAWPDDFKFSISGVPDGYNCIQIDEPKDYDHGWKNNNFCWKSEKDNPGFKWSHQGLRVYVLNNSHIMVCQLFFLITYYRLYNLYF